MKLERLIIALFVRGLLEPHGILFRQTTTLFVKQMPHSRARGRRATRTLPAPRARRTVLICQIVCSHCLILLVTTSYTPIKVSVDIAKAYLISGEPNCYFCNLIGIASEPIVSRVLNLKINFSFLALQGRNFC